MDYWIRGLSHIGILTEAPERAIAFYTEYLGFHFLYRKTLTDGTDCWFAENNGLVLEFVKKHTEASASTRGVIYHIALEVCGIDALISELQKMKVIDKNALVHTNSTFFPSGIKNIFFEGPCGETIELFELSRN